MNIQAGSPGAAFLSNKGSGYPEPKYASNLQGKFNDGQGGKKKVKIWTICQIYTCVRP